MDKDEVKNKIWMVFSVERGSGVIDGIYGFYKNETKAEQERRKMNCKKRDYELQ